MRYDASTKRAVCVKSRPSIAIRPKLRLTSSKGSRGVRFGTPKASWTARFTKKGFKNIYYVLLLLTEGLEPSAFRYILLRGNVDRSLTRYHCATRALFLSCSQTSRYNTIKAPAHSHKCYSRKTECRLCSADGSARAQ